MLNILELIEWGVSNATIKYGTIKKPTRPT